MRGHYRVFVDKKSTTGGSVGVCVNLMNNPSIIAIECHIVMQHETGALMDILADFLLRLVGQFQSPSLAFLIG